MAPAASAATAASAARSDAGVERRGRLVQDEDAAAAQQRARHAEQLALPEREVLAEVRDCRAEPALLVHLLREARRA